MQPAPPPPLPPDPSASSAAQPRIGGVVLRWNAEKGFGFIRPHDGGQDLFCHAYNIDDGNALGEGFDVSFVRKYDDARGKTHADQVCGGVGPRPGGGCDPLLTPCLPYGLEVLASEAQPPRPARAGKRTREQAQQEAIDTSWLSLSAVVRSIGQAPLEIELHDGTRVEGVLRQADAEMNLKLAQGEQADEAGEEGEAGEEIDEGEAGEAGEAGSGGAARLGLGLTAVHGASIRSIRIPKEIDAVKAFHARMQQVDRGVMQFRKGIKKPLPPAQPAERPEPMVGSFATQADAHGADGPTL